MIRELRGLLQDESGPEIVEWVVVTAVLLLGTVPILLAIREKIIELMTNILESLP